MSSSLRIWPNPLSQRPHLLTLCAPSSKLVDMVCVIALPLFLAPMSVLRMWQYLAIRLRPHLTGRSPPPPAFFRWWCLSRWFVLVFGMEVYLGYFLFKSCDSPHSHILFKSNTQLRWLRGLISSTPCSLLQLWFPWYSWFLSLRVECSPLYLLSTCHRIVKSPPRRLLYLFPAVISISGLASTSLADSPPPSFVSTSCRHLSGSGRIPSPNDLFCLRRVNPRLSWLTWSVSLTSLFF